MQFIRKHDACECIAARNEGIRGALKGKSVCDECGMAEKHWASYFSNTSLSALLANYVKISTHS